MSDQRRQINRQRSVLKATEKFFNVRHRTAAVSRHQRSDAHPNKIFRLRVIENVFRVRVNVDKTGRENLIPGVNHLFGIARSNSTYFHDAPVFNRDIGAKPRIAGAVNNAGIGN